MTKFLNMNHIDELLDVVDGYVVGGAVRDYLLGKTIKDFDVATSMVPAQVITTMHNYGWTTYETGIDHGTVTVKKGDEIYEVTTFRKDVDTDGRHAAVEFATTIQEDSLRRDFTMNALYMGRDCAIYDFHGGIQDIVNGNLKFVGDPEQRITEDALRILRHFRFLSENSKLTTCVKSFEAITKCSGLIKDLSAERVWGEFSRILCGENVHQTLIKMQSTGVLDQVCSYSIGKIKEIHKHINDPVIRLWVLCGQYNPQNLKERFRLPNDASRRLIALSVTPAILPLISFKNVRKSLYRYGLQFVQDSLNIMAVELDISFNPVTEVDVPQFPVRGQDLINMHFEPGRGLGAIMRLLEELWIESDFTMTKEKLLSKVETS